MFSRTLWATAFSQFIDNKRLQEEYCQAMAKDGNKWSWEDAKSWMTKKVPQGDILNAHIKSFLNVRAANESTSVFIHRFNNLMSKAQMSEDFECSHMRQNYSARLCSCSLSLLTYTGNSWPSCLNNVDKPIRMPTLP